ncbi:hypothetical protein [Rhizobium sp. BK176]|uniref:hypothetical protein n=1 Tax=Rhizobium sp. BK176 TaxID=2587071 RepID=UPI0021689A11|nr:hypothetical protein [Rhizobium sp. BK176]MCS4091836.1 hypothetical protein [Rhizobium sp. BK176]
MQLRSIAIFLIFSIASLTAERGIAHDIDHESRDRPRLIDNTCADLNSAYRAMREQSRYRETIYELKPDGKLVEYSTVIIYDLYGYQRYTGETDWDRFNNESPYWQRFTSCTRKDMKDGRRFYATYHHQGHVAGSEVWVDSDEMKVKKVIRRFPQGDELFPFATAVSLFDYGRKAVRPPTKYTCGGNPCKL